jgi:hypothetical protein
MPSKDQELLIPPAAEIAEDAYEIVRVWIAESKVLVSLLPEAWEDPAAWGLLLVDIARHVASALSEGNDGIRQEILTRIADGIRAEWQDDTGNTRGGFVLDI